MSANTQVKQVRALHQKKQREQRGLFLVQGRKLVAELLASDFAVRTIYATNEAARELGIKDAHIVAAHDLERMGTFEQGNEVIAVVEQPRASGPRPLQKNELVLALDGITDPGNLGTLLRIADWFGVGQVWCSQDCVELFNPKCVQASMGSIFRVATSYGSLRTMIESAGVLAYKAEATGQNVFEEELQRPAVLVLGSESHGLSDEVQRMKGVSLAVPRFGQAESLNVASAASALCMEFARRSTP